MRISDLAKEEPFFSCEVDGRNKISHQTGINKFDHHRYGDYYDMLFNPMEDKPCRVMEIGISGGFSLLLWDTFLKHPDSHIVGIDPLYDRDISRLDSWRNMHTEEIKADLRVKVFESNLPNYSDRVKVHLKDAYTRNTVALFEDNSFDIVIDDGSHTAEDKKFFIGNYWSKVKPGGWFVIEDFWWFLDFEILRALRELRQVGKLLMYNNDMKEEMISCGAFSEGSREGIICVQKQMTK